MPVENNINYECPTWRPRQQDITNVNTIERAELTI
jgi:hypothetical protein